MRKASLILILTSFFFLACLEKAKITPVKIPILENAQMAEGTRVCLIGDMGTGKPEQYAVARALATDKCDQVRVLGDVIYEKGIKNTQDPLFQKSFYRPYAPMLEAGIPFYIIMGNHDLVGNTDAWLEIAQKYDSIHFPNYWYAEAWGDICFISLDTNIMNFHGQGLWLQETLPKLAAKCKFSIAFAHHPLLSKGEHGGAKSLLKRFLTGVVGKVDMYITGHEHHLSYEGQVKGTHLVISGAGGKLRKVEWSHGGYAASKLGYAVLTIKKNQDGEYQPLLEYRAVENEVPQTDHSMVIKKVRGIRF